MQLIIILVEMGYSYGHYVNCPASNSDRHRFLKKKGCRELKLVELDTYYSLRRAGRSYEALAEFKTPLKYLIFLWPI